MPTFTTSILIALALSLSAHASVALPTDRPDTVCDQAARRAAQETGVPLDVLMAISRVESGQNRAGRLVPWPWTINVEGRGQWFETEFAAKSYVFDIFKAGKRSFDIGCFQINYRWHGKAFRSIDAMFDPVENAIYAANFLTELHAELGSWSAAAGTYHSRTKHLADAYAHRFQLALAQLDHATYSEVQPSPLLGISAPLMPQGQPVHRSDLGSLVPVSGSSTAFIAFN